MTQYNTIRLINSEINRLTNKHYDLPVSSYHLYNNLRKRV